MAGAPRGRSASGKKPNTARRGPALGDRVLWCWTGAASYGHEPGDAPPPSVDQSQHGGLAQTDAERVFSAGPLHGHGVVSAADWMTRVPHRRDTSPPN
ncbi:hypothetical protein J4Q44_G00194150 [Coregonus suidteri]|uniref:Uncharacterized protein n=1 Tax=Coregonus suidteri TaxID=861788 RepID=A0AAN8LHL5_9TELE